MTSRTHHKKRKTEDTELFETETENIDTNNKAMQYLHRAEKQMDEYIKEISKVRIENKYVVQERDMAVNKCKDLQQEKLLLLRNSKQEDDPEIHKIVKRMIGPSFERYDKINEIESKKKHDDFNRRFAQIFLEDKNVEVVLLKNKK